MRGSIAVVVACLAAVPAAGQTSVQQDFEAAEAALAKRDLPNARARYEALLARLKKPNARSGGLVKGRLGAVLGALGEEEAAVPLLSEALTILSADTPDDRSERITILAERANALETLGLFDRAVRDWRAAMAEAKPEPGTAPDIQIRAGLARSLMWTDLEAAGKELDELIAVLPKATEFREQRASILLLRGRVELNSGRFAAALALFTEAAALAGGTTSLKINRTDIKVRNDLALANYLAGDDAEHQRLVAYSGAGSLIGEGLRTAMATPLPPCGDETGLGPGDVAVLEFTIGEDGRVSGLAPIYAARAGGAGSGDATAVATPFVQAVHGWFWHPDMIRKMKPFWRQAVRVELRCSNARPYFDLVTSSFAEARESAMARIGAKPLRVQGSSEAAQLEWLKSELQRRSAAHGPQSVQLVEPLMALARNALAASADRIGWLEQRLAILAVADAAPELVTLDKMFLGDLKAEGGPRRDLLAALLQAEERVRPTARTTNLVRLRLAEAQESLRAPKRAAVLLQAIVDTPLDALGRADPIRTAALLRQSNIAAARKDVAGAAEAFAATGLSAEQCALVDVRPLPENMRVSASVYPTASSRWSTGGFTQVEFDIGTDGRPANVRAVLSSPPFVFGAAAVKGTGQLRFKPSFRPDNALGCLGAQRTFHFRTEE